MSMVQFLWSPWSSKTQETKARLTHLADLGIYKHEKPYELWVNAEPEIPRTNCKFVDHDVPIEDVRSNSTLSNIDKTGVKFLSHKSAYSFEEGRPHQDNMAGYLAESTELLKAELGAEKVFIFDWRYRKNNFGGSKPSFDFLTAKTPRSHAHNPSHVVHSDESFDSGKAKMRRYLTEKEQDEFDFEHYRVRIVNLWRPLIPVVEDAPLVFADRRTVKGSDFIPFDRVLNDRVVEELYMVHHPHHHWFWLSKQKCSEPVMFVTWDSLCKTSDQPVASVPHTSFISPNDAGNYTSRESIELRSIIITRRS
ncbi:uncharacterized protein LY89DRAFT_736082 [Mollisia scopiformis]|uniref:Uncharacterized protein n=1 Tax=Mollisia scopiformis TaxID=149040 RepID=A0A194X5D3_MOLSC|nr:uncharacterized protein LY89DRAFT_736082 [Mollisia scopiformis]KUJ15022.1 hypothetical protein LY89DRAFT_736082 [Mollisia scopiformis]